MAIMFKAGEDAILSKNDGFVRAFCAGFLRPFCSDVPWMWALGRRVAVEVWCRPHTGAAHGTLPQ